MSRGNRVETTRELEDYLGITGFNWEKMRIPARIQTALCVNYLSLKEIVGTGNPVDKKKRLTQLLNGLRDGGAFDVDRLSRVIFLRKLFQVDICQLPMVTTRTANDRDWTDFCRSARDATFADRDILKRLGHAYRWSLAGNIKNNTKAISSFKSAFNNVATGDLSIAIKIAAHFAGNRNGDHPEKYISELLMPNWVVIWHTTPPGKKPIDVKFNKPKLKPHFEKHVCHMTDDIHHPMDECIAWMEVLKYDDRITSDYLKTFLIKPSAAHLAIMFPANAPTTRSSAPSPTSQPGKERSVQVKCLAKTRAARLCFIEHYLCKSKRLVNALWMEFDRHYERIATDTLNACKDGFLYFDKEAGKVFFVGSVPANIAGMDYFIFVMARFYFESKEWEFSTLYLPDRASNTGRLAGFRNKGFLWEGTMSLQ